MKVGATMQGVWKLCGLNGLPSTWLFCLVFLLILGYPAQHPSGYPSAPPQQYPAQQYPSQQYPAQQYPGQQQQVTYVATQPGQASQPMVVAQPGQVSGVFIIHVFFCRDFMIFMIFPYNFIMFSTICDLYDVFSRK